MHSNSKFYMQRVDIMRQQDHRLQNNIQRGGDDKNHNDRNLNHNVIMSEHQSDHHYPQHSGVSTVGDFGGKKQKHKNRKKLTSEDRNQIVKRKEEMLSLLDQAENMYNAGRFQVCFEHFVAAENLVKQVYDPHLDSHPYYTYLAKAILGEAKAKFKMGDIKAAHNLVGQSMQFSPTTDAEHVLREVEKMSYFENLLNFSLTNPLYAYATSDQMQLQQQQRWAVGLDLPQTVGLYTRNSSLYSSLMNVSASPPRPSLTTGSQTQQSSNGAASASPNKIALLDQPRNLTTLDYFSPSSVVVSTVPKSITHHTHKPDLFERRERKSSNGNSNSSSGSSSIHGGSWQKTFLEFVKQHRID